MSPRAHFIAGAAVAAALFALASRPADATPGAAGAVCHTVPQLTGGVDPTAVAEIMNREIANDRTHFNTVRGLSTVLCAW